MVDWIYGQFVAKVAEGRKLQISKVEEIAQGRVWSGTEAKNLGLVDEIGGLSDAVKYAGKQAGLGEHFRLVEYPRSKNLSEAIAEMVGKTSPSTIHIQATGLAGQIASQIDTALSQLSALNDPIGVYARLPMDLDIH
jgi:protease-4